MLLFHAFEQGLNSAFEIKTIHFIDKNILHVVAEMLFNFIPALMRSSIILTSPSQAAA